MVTITVDFMNTKITEQVTIPILLKVAKVVTPVIEEVRIVWEQKTIKMVLMILFSFFKDVFKITKHAIQLTKQLLEQSPRTTWFVLKMMDFQMGLKYYLVTLFSKLFIFLRTYSTLMMITTGKRAELRATVHIIKIVLNFGLC